MKKIILFLAVLFLVSAGCSRKKDIPVTRIEKALSVHKTIHFKVIEKYSYSYTPDTTVTSYEVWAVRTHDSLRHGYVWINNYYRPYDEIYDQGNFYLAIPPKKTTLLYKNFKEAFISPVDWIDIFLNPQKLNAQTTGPDRVTVVSDTVYRGKVCYKLAIRFNNGNKYLYLIDKQRSVPLRSDRFRKTNGYSYSQALLFSDYHFDNVDLAELEARQTKVLQQNPMEEEDPGSETARFEKMLHTGDKAPFFSGTFYANGKPFHLADYIGKKVVLVDFWYTHCPPCVRAIPEISKLYAAYKDKDLVVFGLNSVDNRPGSLKYLKTFLGKRDISYPVVLTQPGVDLRYKINGYPTLYLIDKKGKVAYVEIGFDQQKLSRLKEKVREITGK